MSQLSQSESSVIPQRKTRKKQRESLKESGNHNTAHSIEGRHTDKRAQNEHQAVESIREIL